MADRTGTQSTEMSPGRVARVGFGFSMQRAGSTSAGSDGLWRSSDKGATWKQLADPSVGAVFSNMLRAPDGAFYVGGDRGIFSQRRWATVVAGQQRHTVREGWHHERRNQRSMRAASVSATNGAPTFSCTRNPQLADGKIWSHFPAPGMTQGAVALAYDRQHHVLYSSNWSSGLLARGHAVEGSTSRSCFQRVTSRQRPLAQLAP